MKRLTWGAALLVTLASCQNTAPIQRFDVQKTQAQAGDPDEALMHKAITARARMIFDALDVDSNGSMTRKEAHLVYTADTSPSRWRQEMERYNLNRDNRFEFDEFLRKVYAGYTPDYNYDPPKIEEFVKRVKHVQSGYHQNLDQDKDGGVTLQELRHPGYQIVKDWELKALPALPVEDLYAHFFAQADENSDQHLSVSEVVRLYPKLISVGYEESVCFNPNMCPKK